MAGVLRLADGRAFFIRGWSKRFAVTHPKREPGARITPSVPGVNYPDRPVKTIVAGHPRGSARERPAAMSPALDESRLPISRIRCPAAVAGPTRIGRDDIASNIACVIGDQEEGQSGDIFRL